MARMVYIEDERGCHIWQRALNSRGYGVVWHDGKVRLAHRVAWLLDRGTWPTEGLVIDHVCEVKACINVDHLRELTNRENVLRAPASPMNVTARRTACGRGHSYTPDSLRIDSRGARQCRICDQIRAERKRLALV